jgi:glucosamine--fructose-6-phosphate aminotransferase (isomerizing)
MRDNSLSSNAYVHDILDQPLALRNTIDALSHMDLSAFRSVISKFNSGKLRRIVLTGMGSSFHVFQPLFLTLIAHGLNAQMIETSELIHYAESLIEPSTLIVAASQSGRSAEIIQLLEKVQGKVMLIGVTNSSDSPLATRADAVLSTEAGVESTVSCKTYVTAQAALAVLARILTGQEMDSTLTELQRAPGLVADYLNRWEDHVEAAMDDVKDIQSLMLAGRGISLAAARTGGLIIKEAAHFPAEGMSCAALRHGPLDMMSSRILAVIFEGDRKTARLNTALVADLRKAGGRAYLVRQSDEVDVFSFPPSSLTILPILEILPAQMLSLALALTWRHIPGQFEYITKVTSVE